MALPDRIKVWEALRLFASLAPGAVDWAALVERWGLAATRNASFASLSGGQRQRLFVALALVTHFIDEAERLCDRLAVINRGRVVALDTPDSWSPPTLAGPGSRSAGPRPSRSGFGLGSCSGTSR